MRGILLHLDWMDQIMYFCTSIYSDGRWLPSNIYFIQTEVLGKVILSRDILFCYYLFQSFKIRKLVVRDLKREFANFI